VGGGGGGGGGKEPETMGSLREPGEHFTSPKSLELEYGEYGEYFT
jgi:hypothetical protein